MVLIPYASDVTKNRSIKLVDVWGFSVVINKKT
jgi:hypothetical protein